MGTERYKERFDVAAVGTNSDPNYRSLSMQFAVEPACHRLRMAPRGRTVAAAEVLHRAGSSASTLSPRVVR
jgi:hypothetical protein